MKCKVFCNNTIRRKKYRGESFRCNSRLKNKSVFRLFQEGSMTKEAGRRSAACFDAIMAGFYLFLIFDASAASPPESVRPIPTILQNQAAPRHSPCPERSSRNLRPPRPPHPLETSICSPRFPAAPPRRAPCSGSCRNGRSWRRNNNRSRCSPTRHESR